MKESNIMPRNLKETAGKAGVFALRGFLNLIYAMMKCLPVKEDKVVFCSRQSNEIPLDFRLIQEHLSENGITCVNFCIRVGAGLREQIRFASMVLRSMYHLATSRVCVLDSYWPAVCLLNHKEELSVVQIWHALGKVKKSGYQTLDMENGRSAKAATMLGMHRNYDYIIAGGRYWNPYYCAAFDTQEEKLLNYGLPRIDYLMSTEEANIERFYSEFPQYRGRKIILYAPTFRKSSMEAQEKKLIRAVQGTEFLLIMKPHPIHQTQSVPMRERSPYVLMPDDWEMIDLVAVCDYFITDYSAAALEAAVLRKPTWYWTYDYEEYLAKNGLNLDLKEQVGRYLFTDIDALIADIREHPYDASFMEEYRRKFLPDILGCATEQITGLIRTLLAGTRDQEPANGNLLLFRKEKSPG